MDIRWPVRVDPDPSRVPAPAQPRPAQSDSFRDRLDRVERRAEVPARHDPAPRDTEPTAEVDPLPADSQAPVADPDAPTAPPDRAPTQAAPAGRTAAAGIRSDTTGGGDPARRFSAGKGAGSPTAHSSGAHAAVEGLTATPAQGGSTSAQAAIALPGQAAVAAQATPAPSTAEGKLAAVEALREGRSTARAQATQPGFRSFDKGTLKMAEMARDSVFRQIAFRLHRDGGEMRVLLDPPELGELDMHLVVEKGGALRLSIAAERPEMVLMLDKHLLELRQALQNSGLQVVNAEVHERDRHGADAARRDGAWGSHAETEPEAAEAPAAFRRKGYIHAEGLDFWV